MGQPPPYTPNHSFVADSATLANFPGQALDVEFQEIKSVTDAIETNLALIQRDDGELKNESVDWDQLTLAVKASIGDTTSADAILAARDDAVAAASSADISEANAATSATNAAASATAAASSASTISVAGTTGTGAFVRAGSPSFSAGVGIGGSGAVNDSINSGAAGISWLVTGSTKAQLISGFQVGLPGDKGAGTINTSGTIYQNSVAVVPGLYPEWYGAVGDGVANDTSAIVAWLSAANGKIALGSPGKTYLTDPIVLSQTNTNVPRLLDMQGATIKARAASANPLLTIENPHGIVPYNFEFKNAKLDANATHGYPLKIHGMQQGIIRNIYATAGTTGGVWFSGDSGFGIYYSLFENIASESNTGAAFIIKSVGTGTYYLASNTWLNCRAGGSSTFGYDVNWASGLFVGCESEGNTSGGWNLDNTIDLVLLDPYTEINGSPDKSFVSTANSRQVKILGGRVIGTITASLLAEVTNFIITGDASGNALNYIGGVSFTSTGVKLPASTGFGLGGATPLADSFNSTNALTFLVGGASEMTLLNDGSITSGLTALKVTYHNGTALQRIGQVSVGAVDTGGAGFRLLRVPN